MGNTVLIAKEEVKHKSGMTKHETRQLKKQRTKLQEQLGFTKFPIASEQNNNYLFHVGFKRLDTDLERQF